MSTLMYGAGLGVMECCRLRVKDIDAGMNELVVRDGKGGKDRRTVLPAKSVDGLKKQVEIARLLHEQDAIAGCGEVWMPCALSRKYPQAASELAWQFCSRLKVLRKTRSSEECFAVTLFTRAPYKKR